MFKAWYAHVIGLNRLTHLGCLRCLSEAVSQVSNIQGLGKRILTA